MIDNLFDSGAYGCAATPTHQGVNQLLFGCSLLLLVTAGVDSW
jgi:hypothetical protein